MTAYILLGAAVGYFIGNLILLIASMIYDRMHKIQSVEDLIAEVEKQRKIGTVL